MIKPEWYEALKEIEYRDWKYGIYGAIDYEYLQITFFESGEKQYCRKWRLENRFTVSDIVRTAWLATLAAEEHEARERFKYKGKSIFGPHFDVDKLVELAKYKENLDLREEAMVT